MQDYGFLSIVPHILTIAVALYRKNVLVALIVGIASGSFIIVGFNPFEMMFRKSSENRGRAKIEDTHHLLRAKIEDTHHLLYSRIVTRISGRVVSASSSGKK